ncbi:MAG: hypothetical protein M0P13_04475, partial [Fibrobacteraceae bacterium]|nr:hypothetical protein [Fibrobacteraceae bacterium]
SSIASSSGTVNSSGSTGTSSGGTVNSSGSTGTSSGGTVNSSGSTGTSSSGTVNSSGSTGRSSSSGTSGNGDDWVPPWVTDTTVYESFDDDSTGSDNSLDEYPTNDKRDKGDTLVTSGVVLVPSDSVPTSGGTIVVINGNTYLVSDSVKSSPLTTYAADSSFVDGREAVNVGEVVQITLDADKITDYFGADVGDTIYVTGSDGLLFVDPSHPSTPSTSVAIVVTGDDLPIWVTADTTVSVGSIYFTDAAGHLIIFDGINFIDPIPDADIAYIQDSDDDGLLDSVEVILEDTIPKNISVTALSIVVNGDTLDVNGALSVIDNRIYGGVSDLALSADSFPDNAKILITYTDANGVNYVRETSLIELGTHVIKDAYAIRDNSKGGRDSLFIEFNIDLIPADLSTPEFIVFLNGLGFNLDEVSVYLPTKNILILVCDSLKLKGNNADSVVLAPGATFESLPYVASSEYDRQVPVTVKDRYPGVKYVEYYDNDGDGVLDSIVAVFSATITEEELSNFYFSFPWYSSRGLLIELQAQPADLILNAGDTSVSWRVQSNVTLASNLTSINSEVPAATLYTYYSVFGNTFVNSESIVLVDKMAPVISGASLHYADGSSKDTLIVSFSEAVDYSTLSGRDFFVYIHGKDTLDLNPSHLVWAADGKSVSLIISTSENGIVPGDSLMVVDGAKSSISDIYGNVSIENASPVVISGLLGHLVESVNMGSFDPSDYVTSTLNSVSISYVPSSTRTSDLRDEGTLGHLISLGERFVPQLIDGAKVDADGNYDPSVLDSINPADILVNFSVSYFDNLGQYVTDTTFNIPCNSAAFGENKNCLTTDKKVFVNWNYKDHKGRLVGTGVYIVQFKLVVRYKQKKVEEEMRDKWGVRRKTK